MEEEEEARAKQTGAHLPPLRSCTHTLILCACTCRSTDCTSPVTTNHHRCTDLSDNCNAGRLLSCPVHPPLEQAAVLVLLLDVSKQLRKQ